MLHKVGEYYKQYVDKHHYRIFKILEVKKEDSCDIYKFKVKEISKNFYDPTIGRLQGLTMHLQMWKYEKVNPDEIMVENL